METLKQTMMLYNERKENEKKKKKKSWRQRMENVDKKWEERRHEVLNNVKSTYVVLEQCSCGNKAIIRCSDCHNDLCISCDKEKHFLLPLHNRSSFVKGYLEPLLPNECLDDKGRIQSIGMMLYCCHFSGR